MKNYQFSAEHAKYVKRFKKENAIVTTLRYSYCNLSFMGIICFSERYRSVYYEFTIENFRYYKKSIRRR